MQRKQDGSRPMTQPWFHEGLKFTCTQCGDCCTGEAGFVWVNREEMTRLAERIGVSIEDFERDYVRKVGSRFTLRERANGDCVLLHPETRGCTAYEDRPRQCRTWPFWSSNVRTPQTWAETCEACP